MSYWLELAKATSGREIRDGLKGFPNDRGVCECYPECRNDCPDWKRCYEAMPVYWSRQYQAKKYAEAVRLRKPLTFGGTWYRKFSLPSLIDQSGYERSPDRYWSKSLRAWCKPYTEEVIV